MTTLAARIAAAAHPAAALLPPSLRPDELAQGGLLFHGTCETIDGPLRGGGYDGVLWTASSPAVAQTYIPDSGSASMISISQMRMEDRVRPELGPERPDGKPRRPNGHYALALALGFPPAEDISTDFAGRGTNYRIPQGYPRNRDLVAKLVEMGYPPPDEQGNFCAWIKAGFEDGADGEPEERFYPADWNIPGQLFIIEVPSGLKIFDLAQDQEGDLTDLDYHKVKQFEQLAAEGWDGVRINDFCQTKIHGNVGHISIGFFPAAIAKLTWTSVPAVHWEWPASDRMLTAVTPQFETVWQAAQPQLGSRIAAWRNKGGPEDDSQDEPQP